MERGSISIDSYPISNNTGSTGNEMVQHLDSSSTAYLISVFCIYLGCSWIEESISCYASKCKLNKDNEN